MKDKRKAILTVCGIGAACLAILLSCWYFSKSDGGSFTAEGNEPSAVDTWAASSFSPVEKEPIASSAVETPEEPLKDYPKVIAETSSEVVIDFTPPESVPVEETPPESQEEYTPPAEVETGGGGGETAGQPAGDGVIDDPVFGKVYAGEGQQQEVDNNGDPEKQVGTM